MVPKAAGGGKPPARPLALDMAGRAGQALGVAAISFVHAFTFLRTLGGVQSVLQHHRTQDQRWGLDSRILSCFEPDDPGEPRVRGLGLTWRHTISQARGRFARLAAGLPQPRVIGYYNFWGLPFFAALDGAERRIGVLHGDWRGLPECLRRVRGLADGVLCVSPPLLELVRDNWPGFPAERAAFLPCPVNLPAPDTAKPPLAGRPLVVGFCGRISRQEKRVDRFPALYRQWAQAGLDFRLEFLGEGPHAGWLQRQFAGQSRVVFHGRLSGAAYWQALRGWDAIVFVSDYEGLPIALMEAMSVGVVPIYPRIGYGGGEYVSAAAPEFWYQPGELSQITQALSRLRQMPAAELQALRDRCGETVRAHLGDGYFVTFSSFVRRICELPRISRTQFPSRPFYWSDYCPFGLLRRLYPRGFWRADEP